MFSGFEPPLLRCAWASFYMLKGSPTGGNVVKGKNGKGVAVGTTTCTVYPISDPEAKVIVSRNGSFLEERFLSKELSGRMVET